MRGPQAEAPCALQALTSALTLSPCREHNCAGSSGPTPTSPPSSKSPRPATCSSVSSIHSYSPSGEGGDPDEEVVESSSIRRRGQDGQAVGLSEDGAPSPTRIQRRSPARGHAAVSAKELRLMQPLCDPRIAALRAGVENNAENEAPSSSRLHSRTAARTSPAAASHRTGPRTRLSSPLPCKAYSVSSRSVACARVGRGGSSSGSRGAAMELD